MSTAIRHILAAVDFSPAAELVLQWACREAVLHGARLTIAHVFSPQAMNLQLPEEILPPDLDLMTRLHKLAELEMAKLKSHCDPQIKDTDTLLIDSAQGIGHALVQEAQGSAVDLIVVASHGQGMLGRLLLGSVATDVVHHAHCPVLVVKPEARA
ncbi:universal stress protein [Acidithiobacillus sp.]|uniref:universal stress protein n=1 Tax=Acidithiobacillus sp. TaxID=1872118 RepID=UPI0025BF1F27|nr:universal stress protein [Acidithiobacillus sp.]